MPSLESVEGRVEQIRHFAGDAGTFIILSPLLSGSNSPVVRAFLELSDFLKALTHVQPRLLYLDIKEFDAAEMAVEHSMQIRDDDEGDDYEVHSRPFGETAQFKALQRRWSANEGTVCSFRAIFIVDAVHNTCIEVSEWLDSFHEDVEKVWNAYVEAERDRAATARADRQEDIRAKAKTLSEHPQFSAPKSSKAKREYVAHQIFPKTDYRDLGDILELADLLFWYRGSTPKLE